MARLCRVAAMTYCRLQGKLEVSIKRGIFNQVIVLDEVRQADFSGYINVSI